MRNQTSRSFSSERGFTLTELMISTAILLLVTGTALGTFRNAMNMTDMATQFADANQNLRAGSNQMVKDIMQAGRIIGPEGIPVPNGAGAQAPRRPGPPGTSLMFDVTTTTNLPDITSGQHLGPIVRGSSTDVITLMTVDPFMPTIETPPSGSTNPNEGTIAPSGASVTLPATSLWLVGDPASDTPPVHVGDLVLFKNPRGMAIQTITRVDGTHIYFDANDWFNFNQRNAPQGTVMQIKDTTSTSTAWVEKTSLFRVMMITYYVDAVTTPTAPRLMRVVNNYTPQALAGVIEDLDFTYDLVDGVNNPVEIPNLPYTDSTAGVTYNANQIRKVNVHIGVRSESISRVTNDYVRNHISTSVDVRSLASVDRYV
ncbi:MAG: prepilin-type N-terminal cleavage/methylation domain-containing protein [Vicinamibacterales bacterium]